MNRRSHSWRRQPYLQVRRRAGAVDHRCRRCHL